MTDDLAAAKPSRTPEPLGAKSRPGSFQIGRGARALTVDVPIVLAPMAAITNVPFRLLCRELGAGLSVTEAAHPHKLIEGDAYTWQLATPFPGEAPLIVQLYGREPELIAQAAALAVERGAHAIDLNMGCPMPKIVKKGIGAALLQEPKRIVDILTTLQARVDVPVTVKMRAGWQSSDVAHLGRVIEDAGGAAITIHGRTRSDRYTGHADLDAIAEMKDAVELPVIGNGDVVDVASAARMFEHTGCDAVMVGRGAMGNPWVFRELAAWCADAPPPTKPTAADYSATMLRHVELYAEVFGEHRTCLEFRKHALAYVRNATALPGAAAAEALVRQRLRKVVDLGVLRTLVADAATALD